MNKFFSGLIVRIQLLSIGCNPKKNSLRKSGQEQQV